MEDFYNDSIAILLTYPGARWGYEDFDNAVPLLRKKIKVDYPDIPNKLPLLPSGEIANLAPPPEFPIQVDGTRAEQDVNAEDSELSEISDDIELSSDENICEEDNNGPRELSVVYLDSCGREVENVREITIDLTSDEDREKEVDHEDQPSSFSEIKMVEYEDSSDEELVQSSLQVNHISSVINKPQDHDDKMDAQNGPAKMAELVWPAKTAKMAQLIVPNGHSSNNKKDEMDYRQNGRIVGYYRDQTSPNKTDPQANNNSTRPNVKIVPLPYVKKEKPFGVLKYTFMKAPFDHPETASDDESDGDEPLENGYAPYGNGSSKSRIEPLEISSDDEDDESQLKIADKSGSSSSDEGEEHFSMDEEINNDLYPYSSDDDDQYIPRRRNAHMMNLKDKGRSVAMFINVRCFKPKDIAVYINHGIIKVKGEPKLKRGEMGNKKSKKVSRQYRAPDFVDVDYVRRCKIKGGVVKIVCPKKFVEDDWQ